MRTRFVPATLAFLCLLAPPALTQTTWWVDKNNSNCAGGNGSSENPFCTIQAALNVASSGDLILVMPAFPSAYVENLIFVPARVTLRSDRDGNPATCDIDCGRTTIQAAAAGHVVTFKNGPAGAVFQGFTVTGGNATNGGGIYIESFPVTLKNNIISGNVATSAGGGIYCKGSSPELIDNVISSNAASRFDHYSSFSTYGGGVCFVGSSAFVLKDNEISGNQCYAASGDCCSSNYAYGGGIYLGQSSGEILGNIVSGNTVSARNNTFGGGIYCTAGSNPKLIGTSIASNSAQYGGGVYCASASSPLIKASLIADNSATVVGGGVDCVGGASPWIESSVFKGNSAPTGGGVFSQDSTPVIKHCTFYANSANQGGGIAFQGTTKTKIEGTILWANTPASQIDAPGSAPSVCFSDVQGGWTGSGMGNINANPLFTNPSGCDFSLLSSSPCIDAGDPADQTCTFDFSRAPRRQDGTLTGNSVVDMGALEMRVVSLSATGTFKPGGMATLSIQGDPRLSLYFLFIAIEPGEHCLNRFGSLLIDFNQFWGIWQMTPGSSSFLIPTGTPTPLEPVFQVLGISSSGQVGNTSNAVQVCIDDCDC